LEARFCIESVARWWFIYLEDGGLYTIKIHQFTTIFNIIDSLVGSHKMNPIAPTPYPHEILDSRLRRNSWSLCVVQ
jgi:hypothetical protein